MKRRQVLLSLGAAGLLGGCTAAAEVSSRNLSPGVIPAAPRNYRVVKLGVAVPDKLKVNEANLYYPFGDIVWRDEPYGDRHQQVQKIVREAALKAVAPLDGRRDVDVAIQVARFHALSEKARITVGGVHELRFWMSVADTRTRQVLEGPRFVIADFQALGGETAMQSERDGQGQRVRIIEHLTAVIRQELTAPVTIDRHLA